MKARALYIRFDDGTQLARDWMSNHRDAATQVLERHRHSYPQCLCCQARPRLYIRATPGGGYTIARMPNTGPLHAPDCPAYELPMSLGDEELKRKQAISSGADGLVIRLKEGLRIGGRNNAAGGVSATETQSVTHKRGEIGLYGVLIAWLREAGFHRWYPRMRGRRGYPQLVKYLSDAAERIQIKGQPLSQRIILPPPFKSDRAAKLNEARRDRYARVSRDTAGNPTRFFVAGLFKRCEADAAGERVNLQLRHMPASEGLCWTLDDWRRFTRSYHLHGDKESHPVLLLAIVERQGTRNQVCHATAVHLTEHYLPVQTAGTGALQGALVDLDRAFIANISMTGRLQLGEPVLYLLDTGSEPTSLYLGGQPPEEGWYWDPAQGAGTWPALPDKAVDRWPEAG